MDARTRLDGTRSRWVRGAQNVMRRAARRLSKRLVFVCTVIVLVTLVVPTNGLDFGISVALAKGPKPNHSPTTAASFQEAANTATQQSPKWVRVPIPGPRVYSGLKPGDALPSTGKVRNHAASVHLDTQFLKGHGGKTGTIHWFKSSEGVLEIGVPEGALDLSGVKAPTPTTPPSPTPSATATATATPTAPVGSPGATPAATAQTTPAVGVLPQQAARTLASQSAQAQQTQQVQTDTTPTYTLELDQTGGTIAGETMVLGTYDLQVMDDQGQPVEGAQLDEPVDVVFNYAAGELDTLNPDSVMLSWPQTGDENADMDAAAVPVTMNPDTQTLTASVATLQPGPMVLSAGIADANQASSEHLTADPNLGNVSFSLPFDLPPAAGGMLPPLQMVYNSEGPNQRHSRQAPAGALGDGWDLSLGSISYDADTRLYYLNDVGGVSEPLLCCTVDAAGVNYFVPHHHPEIRVYTLNNTTDPENDTHSTAFTVLTPDGTEYRLGWQGASGNAYSVLNTSRRFTLSGGVKKWYEWDVDEVVRRSATASTTTSLQRYTVDYWQDVANSGGAYNRDAYIKDVYYNYDTSGTAHARVYFNIHWPNSSTTDSGTGATATTYGTNYNCSGSPYQSTTLRCDDPRTPTGWLAAPLTMATITVDSMVAQVKDSGGTWQNVRKYAFAYNADDPWTECWDQMSGQNIACSGEHTLASVTETPYQGGTAEPSLQPTNFRYTALVDNEYQDTTVLDSSGNPYDAQSWWKYLSSFSDGQTGASSSIGWATAYGNTHGVPSGHNVDDPLTCDSATCTHANDRQWPQQVVTAIRDNGEGTSGITTNYSYQLSETCGSGCTQDSWIPPNGWNACGDHGLPPQNPNQSCLTTTYGDYYKEEFTGFLASTATHPDGSATVTTYSAGGGWGTNDWDFANVERSLPASIVDYPGSPASTNPLREVDNTYNGNDNCPVVDGTNQLYVNPYLFCQVWQTKQVTAFFEGNSTSTTVPTLTQTWFVNASPTGANHYLQSLQHTSITANDLAADSFGTTSTQPTFTTNYTYSYDDQIALGSGHPNSYLYRINLPAMTTLDDDQGTRWTCTRTEYDGQGYLTGQVNTLLYGLATQQDAYSDCGNSGNSYAMTGKISTGAGYDGYGQALVASDADTFAGISGHAGCSASTTPLVAGAPSGATTYTGCTTYDSVQHAYPTTAANALNQSTAATYDIIQGIQTSATDANSQTTTTPAPVYEYSGSPSLSTYQDTYADTKLPGETATWTTRTFAFSFCTNSAGTFLTGTAPCVEIDTVQQLDGSNVSVIRQFYDRDGRLVETRAAGPDGSHDVVTFTRYDDINDKVFASLPCTVAALSTSNGGRAESGMANYIAPAAISTGSGAYVDPTVSGTSCYSVAGTVTYTDAFGRTIAIDDAMGTGAGTSGTGCLVGSLHHTTCAYYQVAAASTSYGMPSSDTAVYLRTVAIDANLHQSASYSDALGRGAYGVEFTGSGQSPLSGVSLYATTARQYDPLGNVRVVIQPNGAQSTSTYDRLGNVTATSDPDLGAWSYTYDANGNVRSSTDPRGTGGGGSSTTLVGDSTVEAWNDDNTDGSAEAFPYTASASGTASSISLYLDASNTATSVDVGLYSDNGSSGSPAPATLLAQATITSPHAGAWNTVSLPAATVTSGTKYWIALLSPTGSGTVEFRDIGGTGVSAGSASSTLSTLPSTWTTGASWASTSLSAYVSATTSGSSGGAVYANYDGLNRQLWRNTSDTASGAYVAYSYDSTASGNKGVGRLTGESFTGGTASHVLSGSYAYAYDVRGELTQQTLTTESSTHYTLGYGYNDAGMPTSLTYTDGEELQNFYGTTGWLSAVTTTPSGGSQVNLLTNLSYGGPALQLTGASQGNGTYAFAASYDNDGQQTNSQLTRTSDSTTIFASARSYDAAGNVTGVATTLPSGTDNQAFCYDALNRLVWAGSTGTPSCGSSLTAGSLTGAQYTQTFSYDTLDRLTGITSSGATGSSPGSYTYGDSAHLHAATATAGGYSTTYDAAGDMVCRAPTSATTCTGVSPTGAQLTYDAERRLTHYQDIPGSSPNVEAWYLYDGAGNRVEQAVKQSGVTTSTYYLAGGAEEVRSDGSLVKYYGDHGLNTGATASTISYLASDGLGSLQVALDGSGNASAEQLNAPYGTVRYSSGVFPTTKGFTGQRSDAAVSGLDYYGARYYDPMLGQFTSADSVLAGLNRYGYVASNPETLIDPSGHAEVGGNINEPGGIGGGTVDSNEDAGSGDPFGDFLGKIGDTLDNWFSGGDADAATSADTPTSTSQAGHNGDNGDNDTSVATASTEVGSSDFTGAGQDDGDLANFRASNPSSGDADTSNPGGTGAGNDGSSGQGGRGGNGDGRGGNGGNDGDGGNGGNGGNTPFTPNPKTLDPQGRLTNGTYTIDPPGMAPHMPGTALPGRSVFLTNVDAETTVLDAAQFADENNLWFGNDDHLATVYITNGPVGVHAATGELVDWVTVSRTLTGFIHGWPSVP